MRRFEVARKMRNDGSGQFETRINPNTGIEEIVYWDVKEEDMPEYATLTSAGADFRAAEDVVVKSIWGQIMKSGMSDTTRAITNSLKDLFGNQKYVSFNTVDEEEVKREMAPTIIHTGIKACMEEDEVLCLYNRSSGPKKLGLVLANSVGVVDSDFYNNPGDDGEIKFAFYNFFPFDVTIKKGDKIGQGVFYKYLRAEGARIGGKRVGGFGSTSKSESSVNLFKNIHENKGLDGLGNVTPESMNSDLNFKPSTDNKSVSLKKSF